MEKEFKYSGPYSKRDILNLLFKRKNLILSIFLYTIVLVAAGSYIVPSQYEAISEIYVKRNIPPLPIQSRTLFINALERKEAMSSEVNLIESKAVIEKAAEIVLSDAKKDMGLDDPDKIGTRKKIQLLLKSVKEKKNSFLISLGLINPASEVKELSTFISEKLEVNPLVNSSIIEITYQNSDPEFAARIVNTVTKVYLEKHLELIKRPGTFEFYNSQVQENESVIKKMEQDIQSFREQKSIISVEDQKRLKVEELSTTRKNLNEVEGEKAEISRKIEILKEQISSQPEKVVGSKTLKQNPRVEVLNAKLLDLEIEKNRLLQIYSVQSTNVKEINKAIQNIQEKISQESLSVVDAEIVSINTTREHLIAEKYQAEADLNSKTARELVLTQQIRTLENELRLLDKYDSEMKTLTRTRDSMEKSLADYISQREEARIEIDPNINATDVRVVRWASIPEMPKYSRLFLTQIGALAGLMAGFLMSFVMIFFDHSLNNKEDVDYYLKLPLIASISENPFNQNLHVKSGINRPPGFFSGTWKRALLFLKK